MQKGEHYRCAEFIPAAGMQTSMNYHVETTGEFRRPYIGEWYIAAGLVGRYVATQLRVDVHIARLVETATPEIVNPQPPSAGRFERYERLCTRGYRPVAALLLALCLSQASFDEEVQISQRDDRRRGDHADD